MSVYELPAKWHQQASEYQRASDDAISIRDKFFIEGKALQTHDCAHELEAALQQQGEVVVGDWVLVPKRLGTKAQNLLSNFDMDSIGNNPHDAADECWEHLVEMCGQKPPILLFDNPVFHAGNNLTVRRGEKWSREAWATVLIGEIPITVGLSTLTYNFYQLKDHHLRNEHDPSCRTVAGLFAELCRVYPGFNRGEMVTLVTFSLPTYTAFTHPPKPVVSDITLPPARRAEDYAEGVYGADDLAAIWNVCRDQCRLAVEAALGVKS